MAEGNGPEGGQRWVPGSGTSGVKAARGVSVNGGHRTVAEKSGLLVKGCKSVASWRWCCR